MERKDIFDISDEKPLDRILHDGGVCGIFRTIACIGDSLSSGEFESQDEEGNRGYHDYYEYSWGQYMARSIGATVYNFSRGGMTAREYCESFEEEMDFWNPEKKCQAYIIALGVKDVTREPDKMGEISDIDLSNYENNRKTFAGYFGQIIQRMKEIQPKARFFIGSHMNAAGYLLTSKMVMSYIDYIIRHNMEDFLQVGFIGTPYHNCTVKW